MCLVIVRVPLPGKAGVVVAANRDEFYDRPAVSPSLLDPEFGIVAGRDLRAGGTWLGVNRHGVLATVANRHTASPEDAGRHSRGLLCLDTLRSRTVPEAVERALAAASAQACNPFNLLVADSRQAWLVCGLPAPVATPLTPGWHVIGNGVPDDRLDPRVARALALIEAAGKQAPVEGFAPLEAICADHGADGQAGADTLCMHGVRAGTRSSAVCLLPGPGAPTQLRHADGHPCRGDYAEVPLALPS